MNIPAQPSGQFTVLVVEDDELLRDAMIRVLVREEYQVLTAQTGHDAIGVLRTPACAVDVAILDIGLPDVRGTNLCARLRELFPRLPVVVCSGDASMEETVELRRLGISHFFRKPIALNELVSAVRTVVQERN